jgi:hypothetical protein
MKNTILLCLSLVFVFVSACNKEGAGNEGITEHTVSVYPNPSPSEFFIHIEEEFSHAQYIIHNYKYSEPRNINDSVTKIILSYHNDDAGTYDCEVLVDGVVYEFKLFKTEGN